MNLVFWNRSNGKNVPASVTPKPMARKQDLIVQEVEDEVLVYDEMTAQAHCLNLDAARVWRACDGQKTEDALASELGLDAEIVALALNELDSKNLLMGEVMSDGAGATRREFGLKAAKIGGAVAAGPMIYSIVAPTALATVTTPNKVCNFYSGSSCDACAQICGCCCCCQGCSKTTGSPACKMCSSIQGCDAIDPKGSGCPTQLHDLGGDPGQACSSGPNCSDTAKDPPKCSPGCIVNPNGVGSNAACPGEDPNDPNAIRGDFCPSLDCHTHDCNCFGINTNPCVGF